MAAANVLLVGLKGLGVEIAKNLILGGLGSVTLLDSAPVELRDLGASSRTAACEKFLETKNLKTISCVSAFHCCFQFFTRILRSRF